MNRRSTQSPVEVLASLTCDSGDTELWLFLPTRESPEEMSGEEGQTAVGADGPTRSELAARERAVLKSIDGVTSVTFNARKMREPLNKDTLYVRVRGHQVRAHRLRMPGAREGALGRARRSLEADNRARHAQPEDSDPVRVHHMPERGG